ncbi:hypothetical protein D3C86_2177610 [compost metagenome]
MQPELLLDDGAAHGALGLARGGAVERVTNELGENCQAAQEDHARQRDLEEGQPRIALAHRLYPLTV